MKHITEFGLGAAMLLTCTGTLFADPPTDPQSQVAFEAGSSGTWNMDWEGVVGRVYFIQWSIDLLEWNYLPVIEAGEDISSFGAASSSDKFFLRLHYANFDPEDSDYLDAENADYDNDDMSNLFEVMNGFNPFVFDAIADPDGDGLNNANEQTAGTDPKSKDNPAVKLSVVVTGD
jgi:hypothetical protein